MELIKENLCFGAKVQVYEHESEAIGLPMRFSVINTQANKALVWLSGLTCNEENFITKAHAVKVAAKLGISIFCPDTSPRGAEIPGEKDSWDFGEAAGFYLDAKTPGYDKNYKMESYLISEFIPMIIKEFKVHPKLGLFGHSMGGHGALTLGIKYQEKFGSLSAFAPIVNPTQCPWGQKAFTGYLGENKDEWKNFDTCELLKSHELKIPVLIDQGTNDEFLKEQLLTGNLESILTKNQQPIEVRYQNGYDHSYYFIQTFIEDHINFHLKNLH